MKMRVRSTQEMVRAKHESVLEFLRERGEASAKDLCIFMGYSWPAKLEQARSILLGMQNRGLIVKSVRPNRETRIAYYSIPSNK